MQAVVDFLHEGVEVDTASARNGTRLKKQIHQHRFAATDPAVDIDSARARLPRLLGRDEAQQLPPAASSGHRLLRLIMQQRAMQHLQLFGCKLLHGVAFQQISGAAGAVGRHRAGKRVGGSFAHIGPGGRWIGEQPHQTRTPDTAHNTCPRLLGAPQSNSAFTQPPRIHPVHRKRLQGTRNNTSSF